MQDIQRQIRLELPSPIKLFTPVVTTILILKIIGFALFHHANGFTCHYLALSRSGVTGGQLWQPVTYQLLDSCLLPFIINLHILLFIGSAIEREWRSRSFLIFWIFNSVVCAFVWLFIMLVFGQNWVILGSAECVFGLVAIFGVLFRKTRFILFFWSVEAHVIAWLIIAFGCIVRIPSPITLISVTGALVGYLYIKTIWKIKASGGVGRKRDPDVSRFIDLD